ncbi:Ubiquitin carboxyl-terminal hydrolase 16 [Schistosoma japonicum]|nr:Ubiquitin carboxyl-terminal hydrolase 16 [Schistosoma japonicum]
MQAIAANPSLVRLLNRSAHMRPDKFMYRLLCLLNGLQCSSQYITENKLGGILKKSHDELINDIVDRQNWLIHEQQDVHELFGFIMERACSQDSDFPTQTYARKISNLFNFNLSYHERIVICRSHCSAIESVKCRSILCDAFPTGVFEQTLVASRITCNRCNYHSKVVIQPEACLTVFLKNPSTGNTNNLKRLQPSHIETSPKIIDLIECLDAQSTTVEPIIDMKCPKCQEISTSKPCSLNCCQREQWITHIPKYLVLYIQRSDWLNIPNLLGEPHNIRQLGRNPFSATRIATKRSEHVHIPEFLNMAPYLSPYEIPKPLTSSQVVNPSHDKCSKYLFSNTSELSEGHCLKPYILRSVIVHEGAFLQCGHYITYRRWHTPMLYVQQNYWLVRVVSSLLRYVSNYFQGISNTPEASNSSWILTSDTHVERVPFKQVESSPAYLLFYERLCGSNNQRLRIKPKINASGVHTLSPMEESDTNHSERYSDDEKHTEAMIDKLSVFKNLSKADTIRAYELYASTFQMHNKSCDVFYF